LENGRCLFTAADVLEDRNLAEDKAKNIKDASPINAQITVDQPWNVNAGYIWEK
jgi:hypothetical protein